MQFMVLRVIHLSRIAYFYKHNIGTLLSLGAVNQCLICGWLVYFAGWRVLETEHTGCPMCLPEEENSSFRNVAYTHTYIYIHVLRWSGFYEDGKSPFTYLYNIICTVNTQYTSRQDAIITNILYLATYFGRNRPSSGQLRTILSYSKNST